MHETLPSEKYGVLYLMEDTEYPVYCGEIPMGQDREIGFNVHYSGIPENDESALLKEVERRIDWLMANELNARQRIAAAAVHSLSACWTGIQASVPMAENYAETLKLSNFNCFPNNTYECWYENEEPVAHVDLTAEFDEEFNVVRVNFDG